MYVHLEIFVSVIIGLAVSMLSIYGFLLCLLVGESVKKKNYISKLKNEVDALKETVNRLEFHSAGLEKKDTISSVSVQSSAVTQCHEDFFCYEDIEDIHQASSRTARATTVVPAETSAARKLDRAQADHDYDYVDNLFTTANAAYLQHKKRNTFELNRLDQLDR